MNACVRNICASCISAKNRRKESQRLRATVIMLAVFWVIKVSKWGWVLFLTYHFFCLGVGRGKAFPRKSATQNNMATQRLRMWRQNVGVYRCDITIYIIYIYICSSPQAANPPPPPKKKKAPPLPRIDSHPFLRPSILHILPWMQSAWSLAGQRLQDDSWLSSMMISVMMTRMGVFI